MTGIETILGGIIIAVVSGILGKAWGESGKISEKECTQRQKICATPFCLDLDHLKRGQQEIKDDIAFIKNHMIESM